MDAFELLEADHHRIEQQLREFIAGYDQMPPAKTFELSSLIFDKIKRYFELQESLLFSTSRNKEGAQAFVKECLQDRTNIMGAMDNLLMSHVDDSDFREGLRALIGRFDAHLRHYGDKLFVEFRRQLSSQELSAMNSQANEWMLNSV